jgi:SAM-dependent methyltransferase
LFVGSSESDNSRGATERKLLGAWYTPNDLVARVLDAALDPVVATSPPGCVIRVLDPACGDGRFLVAARERIERAGRRADLTGVDVDRDAVTAARAAIGPNATIIAADALSRHWPEPRFDVIVGNPPFLSQLATATARGGRSAHGGGPYADAAVEFLALCLGLARPDGGRIGLVLPTSIVATRDAADVRRRALAAGALTWFWWSLTPVFDAQVRTCALAIMRGAPGGNGWIRRDTGLDFRACPAVASADLTRLAGESGSWSLLLHDDGAPPMLPPLGGQHGVLGDLATVTADFRDEYYGLVGAVGDDADGPALVTSGLIDPGRCLWGARPTRFAKQRYEAPRVHLDALSAPVRAWADARLVPKVLVASQTRVLEAVADPQGSWLPCVPVVSVVPHRPADVGLVAAVLTSPVASAWLAARSAGSGLSARALRVAAPVLSQLPVPAATDASAALDHAVEALHRGDLEGCAAATNRAYGVEGDLAEQLLAWWLSAAKVRSG